MKKIIKYGGIPFILLTIILLSSAMVYGIEKEGTFQSKEKHFNYDRKQNEPNASILPVSLTQGDDIQRIKAINQELRQKYLNRAELYDGFEEIEAIDELFIASTDKEMVLYANFPAEDFGINTEAFLESPVKVFNSLVKDSEYGIDCGYFLGSSTPQPLDLLQKEVIAVKLTVPAGTKSINVGTIGNPIYGLSRNQTLKYNEKRIVLDHTGHPFIEITAQLVKESELTNKTNEVQQQITSLLASNHLDPDIVSLLPLGLNAGVIFSKTQTIMERIINTVEINPAIPDEVYDHLDIVFADGGYGHTPLFLAQTEKLPLEERKRLFEENFSRTSLGSTASYEENNIKKSTMVITYSRLGDALPLKEGHFIEDMVSTFLHESFHHLIHITNSFEGRPGVPSVEFFEAIIKKAKEINETSLIVLLGNNAASKDPEEYICEAFRAKFHPLEDIRNGFAQKVGFTNYVLDSILRT